MKHTTTSSIAALLLITAAALAEDGRRDAPAAGPNGGRLLEATPQRAEFLLNPDRTVTITFYDEALKSVPPGGHSATVIAEAPSGKEKFELTERDGVLVSSGPLPEGEAYLVVVQIRATPDARPQNFRFDLVTHTCGECSRVEYACICDHAGEGAP